VVTIALPPNEAQLVRDVALFEGLDDDALAWVGSNLKRRHFKRNEVVYHTEDMPGSVYIVLSGRLKLQLQSPGGKSLTMGWIYPGSFFGTISLLDGHERIADAVAKVMKPAMQSRESGTGTQKRMYEGALHLVESLARVPAIVFVCAKNGYPPVNPNIGFVWSAVYPASQNLILAARGLGLGTTFTTFHMVAEPVVRETLGLPDDVLIGTTLCVGYPDRPFGPVARKPVAEVIHWDGW